MIVKKAFIAWKKAALYDRTGIRTTVLVKLEIPVGARCNIRAIDREVAAGRSALVPKRDRKYRADRARVLGIYDIFDPDFPLRVAVDDRGRLRRKTCESFAWRGQIGFEYRVGNTVWSVEHLPYWEAFKPLRKRAFHTPLRDQCGSGIHFFLSRAAAAEY